MLNFKLININIIIFIILIYNLIFKKYNFIILKVYIYIKVKVDKFIKNKRLLHLIKVIYKVIKIILNLINEQIFQNKALIA